MFAKIVLALPFVSGESFTVFTMHAKLITVLPSEFEFHPTPLSLSPLLLP